MDDYFAANRAIWNAWTPIHARSAFYDVAGFKAGQTSLTPIEREEMGDVRGKTLLHLQCHFGLDTLSWARLGAQVTGIDFSEAAITLARSLSAELGLPARFVQTNLYDLPDVLEGQFDLVFTSYGALAWLPDLTRWAQIIAHFLRPGGMFYMVEFHPFMWVFNDDADVTALQVRYSYFHTPEPLAGPVEGSYADPEADVSGTAYEWAHPLGEIVTALAGAGLRLEFLHEFPYCTYDVYPLLEGGADGLYRLPGQQEIVPLLFSIRARKG